MVTNEQTTLSICTYRRNEDNGYQQSVSNGVGVVDADKELGGGVGGWW